MNNRAKLKIGYSSILLFLAAGAMATGASAGIVHGQVRDSAGKAVIGAMVSLSSERGIAESVYTDDRGRYSLDTRLAGDLTLRIRQRYYQDDLRDLPLDAAAEVEVNAALVALTDPQALSDDHPSLSHFAMIDFDEDENAAFSRANFTRDCLGCHSLGNSFTRWPRSAEAWVPSVMRMHGYMGNADEKAINRRAAMLAAAFDGELANSKPVVPIDPLLFKARIHQWRLAGSAVPHDAEYAHSNGKIYMSEMFNGEVLETDLETGETLHFKLPADGEPAGGTFTKMGLPAPYGLTVARAPHSLAEGLDGKLYLTESIGSAITAFDPKTREFENFEFEEGAIYPHTVRVDSEGIVWFTIAFSNQVGRLDPKTGDKKMINLPETATQGASAMPVPYGIAVNPIDGGIWYAKLYSDKIGHIDPKTLKVTEHDSPVRGPRRQRFDAAGKLWVAGFAEGAVAKIDVAKWESTVYALPVFAPGEIPAPYALAVHPQTQDVWVNDTMLDVVWRFVRDEERFVAYPMPLRGSYTRDFTFTDKGWACTSNNPIPAAALEGGVPELVCIDPGDNGAALSGL